jgi:hypothetical protein
MPSSTSKTNNNCRKAVLEKYKLDLIHVEYESTGRKQHRGDSCVKLCALAGQLSKLRYNVFCERKLFYQFRFMS